MVAPFSTPEHSEPMIAFSPRITPSREEPSIVRADLLLVSSEFVGNGYATPAGTLDAANLSTDTGGGAIYNATGKRGNVVVDSATQ